MKTVYTVTASKIKAALVKYLRFKRQMACVSEYSATLRDIEDIAVLYLNSDGKKQLSVYEIKISFSDFMHDFVKQKHKKMPYSRFIYVVAPHMIEKCEKYLKEHYPTYGLMTFDYNEKYKIINSFKTVIRPKTEYKHLDEFEERAFYARLSSMASQCLEKEERIELLQEQLNIFKQDAKQQYKMFCTDSKDLEGYNLKRKLSEVLNAVLSFEEVLNGSMDLPYRYQELLKQEKLNLNEIKKVYEYCKGCKDFEKMEKELNHEQNT
ncbi:hypothetical protein [Succinivibrio dextrinosolvens]|uniref:hypothetical protein n=1 Tax=Succinivibrio dextrinosolvens TaxID=83771 RepID=UPI00241CD506|nr:hypothetical protein [Succinivibrio dextrinosolvens]MBE6422588.1 hypothetical protein [Succinivibrio dextrinosolvens]